MRSSVLVLVLALGLGGVVYVKSRHPETPARAASVNPGARGGSASPAPQVNQHNWPKNALDRASELKRQVAQQRKENEGN